ncbi:MAG TPA: SIR2 family protein [Clostridia bacterium]|nr:SIR2 family protein [Clostridia bacterium]
MGRKKDFIKSELAAFRYEEVASFLKEERGVSPFNNDIRQAFGKKVENNDLLRCQAVFLLPLLFKGLVLTTDFDKVLETVYALNNTSFTDSAVGHPGHTEMLNIALREPNTLTLYKFHGDIAEVETGLVLTKESYDLYYSPDSPLVKELSQCYSQKIILFLGCSLNEDRTMKVLDSILTAGTENYAILPCEKSKIRERTCDLGNRHIRAIFYEEGKYECVRIILERLLEIKDKSAYNRLSYHASDINRPKENRFVYNSGSVGFFGREKEIEKLKEFCNSEDGVKWWAITGEGGSGKSRLAYELKNYLDYEWDTVLPYPYDLTALEKASQGLLKNALFVVDYVQAHAKDIGTWIEKLAIASCAIKIRIILVERDGTNMDDATWMEQIKKGTTAYRHIKKSCYNKEFLLLNALDMEAIKNIMQDYAVKRHAILPDKEASALYTNLQKVDPELTRPLYSLFLVDAWLEKKQPLDWSREEMLDYVVDRETERYKNNIKEVLGSNNDRLEKAFLKIKTMATMVLGLDIEGEGQSLCKDAWNDMEELSRQHFENSQVMLSRAGLAHVNSKGNYILPEMLPDLVGEYFVLEFLKNKQYARLLISSAWGKPIESFIFFSRLFIDYYYLLEKDSELVKTLLEPDEEVDPLLFARFLFNVSAVSDKNVLQLAVAKLEDLVHSCPDNADVAMAFAKGLFNLSNKQDAEGAALTVDKLEGLIHSYSDNADVVVIFAKGLVNLSNKQDAEGAAVTVGRLKGLVHSYLDNADVVVIFAKGLVNLSSKQDAEGAALTVVRLECLVHSYPDNSDIVTIFANGLYNLSNKQGVESAAVTVDRLEGLVHLHPDNAEVIVAFANGLFNLSYKQDAEGAAVTVDRLEALVHSYQDNADVVVAFANGLVNLSYKQDTEGAAVTVDRLEGLVHSYPDNSKVVVAFAKGLVILSNKQDAESAIASVARLGGLAHSYPDNAEVQRIWQLVM